MSSILASAHLQGPGGVALLLLNNIATSDEYGTNILFYMDQFGGYSTPYGTSGNDYLVGSDYSETFIGKEGINEYHTGDGYDKIIITNNASNQDNIYDFDVNYDVISLTNFPGVTAQDLNISNVNGDAVIAFSISIYDNSEGHAVIDLMDLNNQTITLKACIITRINCK